MRKLVDADALWLYNLCEYLPGCSAGTAWHRWLLRCAAPRAHFYATSPPPRSSWSRAAMAAAVPARDTMAISYFLAIVFFTVAIGDVNGQIVFPKDEDRGVRECATGEVCVAKDSCLEYKKKLQARRDATAQDQPEERAKMVEQLRKMICHKAEKKVCCPVTKGKTGESLSESEGRIISKKDKFMTEKS